MTGKPRVCTHDGCDRVTVARRLCRTHYQQAWKAGDLDTVAPKLPRVPAPTVCPPDHAHAASTTCYGIHQCRCEPCRDNRVQREARRRKDIAYGRYDTGLVDIAPVREHVLALGEYGIGYKRVAALAGVHTTVVRNVLWGRQDPGRVGEMGKRIKAENAAAILAVEATPENLAGGARVPARSVHRKVQALACLGWAPSAIGQRAGYAATNFQKVMRSQTVSARLDRRIAAIYDELCTTRAPRTTWHERSSYTRTVRMAAAVGWLAPLAWDDIDNDDAPATIDDDLESDSGVDWAAVEQVATYGLTVPLNGAERLEVIRTLHERGQSDPAIAKRLGITTNGVQQARRRHGIGATDAEDVAA